MDGFEIEMHKDENGMFSVVDSGSGEVLIEWKDGEIESQVEDCVLNQFCV